MNLGIATSAFFSLWFVVWQTFELINLVGCTKVDCTICLCTDESSAITLFVNLIVNNCSLGIAIGQVITAGLDKKIFAWDTRMEKGKTSVFVKSLDSEATSLSLSGLDMMVTMGASIYVCDLRNPQKPFESKDPDMNTPIICGSAIPYAKGIISVLSVGQHVVNHLHLIVAQEDIMPYVELFYIFELDRHLEF